MANRVSVALATFNGERFLAEQLQSLANQSRLPDELVVSDDGSTDDTLTILENFSKSAPFTVILLPGEGRLGYGQNFRRAFNRCSSNLIAFCDQDDVWWPDKIAKVERLFDDPAVLLAYHNANVVELQRHYPLYRAAQEDQTFSAIPRAPFKIVCGLVQMFRADLRRFDDLWDHSRDHIHPGRLLAHDQWFFFLAHALGGVHYLDEILVDYRLHDANTSLTGARPNLLQRLGARLGHVGALDLAYADSAESRARILREIVDRDHRPDLGRVAAMYDELGQRYRRRAAVYLRPSLPARASALIGSVAAGDYGRRPTLFDPRSVVRELWSGVIRQQGSRSRKD